MAELSAGIKDRIAELIGNVQSCATKDGIAELEKLYNGKKKDLGKDITPMMDIMVRDAISGRKKEIESIEAEEKEAAAEKKAAAADAKKVAKMDEYHIDVIDYHDFMNENAHKEINENAINKVVFTYGRMNPPTIAHAELLEQVANVGTAIGGLSLAYLSKSQDPKRNPLDYATKVQYVSEMLLDTVIIPETEARNLFEIMTELAERGFTEMTVVVGSDRVQEFKRCGRYFLKNGGDSFTVINSGNRVQEQELGMVSSSDARLMVEQGDFSGFDDIAPFDYETNMNLYDALRNV